MIEYKGIQWYSYQGALLPRTSPHHAVFLTKEEQKELLRISKALFLRYTNEWDSDGGEFWYVIKDHFDGLQELSANTRSKVKRAQKRNEAKIVCKEYISKYGYEVYAKAFEKYDTFITPINQDEFKSSILKKDNCQFWGVFDKESGKLVAYSENFIEDDMCHYSTIKFHPDFLKNYTSYILFYEMNSYYLDEKKLRYVNDGARSISHETNVQKFLIEKFKFKKSYVKLNIAYRLDVGLAVKILYPFKGLLQKIDNPLSNKISAILKQDAIRRSFG
jgi:hypothetical protein